MLKLDLMRLETPERFQMLCSRLARREFPDALPLAFSSWDGGRDILRLVKYTVGERPRDVKLDHDIIWQAKFTDDLGATTRRSVQRSIASVVDRQDMTVRRWILCLPVDPTGVFHDWLAEELQPTGWNWEIRGASIILEALESNPDLVETFFWAAYEELRKYFRVDDLELFDLRLDPDCEWDQFDKYVLAFARRGNVASPDLVLDLIVRNVGTVDAVVLALMATVTESEIDPHGLPGEGLLFPQITYDVSIHGGQPGAYSSRCEPPLVVKAGGVARFKIRIRDTGYSWRGNVVLGLDCGNGRALRLPAIRLYT